MSGFISCPYVKGTTFSNEANAFFARLATRPTATRGTTYDTMISALVAGGVWAKLDVLYIFAAANQPTAILNLKSSSFPVTNVGTTTFTADAGFTGNGSSMRLDTNWNPSTAGGSFAQTSCSLFAWSNTDIDNNAAIFGAVNNGPENYRLRIYPKGFGTAFLGANIQSSTSVDQTGVATGKGLVTASRTTAAAQALYKDGVLVDSDAADAGNVALLNDVYSFLHITASYWPGTVLAGGMGGGLDGTEQLVLYNALHAYLQTVAGVA